MALTTGRAAGAVRIGATRGGERSEGASKEEVRGAVGLAMTGF